MAHSKRSSLKSTGLRISSVLGASIAVVLLAGCSVGDADTRAQLPTAPLSAEPFPLDMHVSEDGSFTEEGTFNDQTGESGAAADAVVRSGSMTIESDSPADTTDSVVEIVQEAGGKVESRTVHSDPESFTQRSISSSLVLRVPEDQLDDTIEAIHTVGDVVSESHSAFDVTTQRVDLRARVASLETSIERLESLLGDAANVSDLIEIERALSERQAEFDSLTAQLESLDNQISYATLHVDVLTSGSTPPAGPQNFWDAVLAGLASMGAAIAATAIALGFMLPWIVTIGVIVTVVILLILWIRRRRGKRPVHSQSPPV